MKCPKCGSENTTEIVYQTTDTEHNNMVIKYFLKTIIILFLFILIIYMGLWIYTIKYVSQDFKDYYQNSEILEINDSQYKIIWYTLSEDKNYGFKWSPFIFDIAFDLSYNPNEFDSKISIVSLITAETIIVEFGYRDLNNAHLRYYTLDRYISFDNNWKKCLSIIVQNYYYGNDIRNIIDASDYYYHKSIENLTDKELMSLLLLNPIRTIGSQELDETVEKLYMRYLE